MSKTRKVRSERTLVICGCSKMKKNYKTEAGELYEGQIFKSIKKYTENHNYELFILSAKYGLIKKSEIIAPYDQTIKTKKDIKELEEKILRAKLLKNVKKFKRIELLMGNSYLEALLHAIKQIDLKAQIYTIEKKNGIFDYKKNIKKLLENDKSVLYQIAGKKKAPSFNYH